MISGKTGHFRLWTVLSDMT